MSNINQWGFDELPNSKIIITEEVYNRLMLLIGRSAWITSEHSSTLFGRKIDGQDAWIIDEVNTNEDYVSRGTNSTNPNDYSVSSGQNQSIEIQNKLDQGPGMVVIDVHTHPSGLIDDYRFISSGDATTYIQYNSIVSNKGGTFFAGLIGVDRVNGNMSFSIIWYNKSNNKFYRVKDIMLRKLDEYGRITDVPFPKYGNTQLICANWGNDDLLMPQSVEEELTNLKHR